MGLAKTALGEPRALESFHGELELTIEQLKRMLLLDAKHENTPLPKLRRTSGYSVTPGAQSIFDLDRRCIILDIVGVTPVLLFLTLKGIFGTAPNPRLNAICEPVSAPAAFCPNGINQHGHIHRCAGCLLHGSAAKPNHS